VEPKKDNRKHNYAIQHAGTDADLNPVLEAAATDHLLDQTPQQRNEAKSTGPFFVQVPSSKADVRSL